MRGVELRKEETVGEEDNMLDWIEDKEKRDEKEKMPKIDTLDALDDEMTSILNTL